MEVQDIELRAPGAPQNFDVYDINGIKVYVNKRIKAANKGLIFKLKKFLFVKFIIVDGVVIKHF